MVTILSDGVSFHKEFGEPSDDVYCTKEVVEVRFVEIPGGIEEEFLIRIAPSGKLLPGGSKVRGNVRSSSVQASPSEIKLIAAQMDKCVGKPRTQHKLTSCQKSNKRIKDPRSFTMYGMLYLITAVIMP